MLQAYIKNTVIRFQTHFYTEKIAFSAKDNKNNIYLQIRNFIKTKLGNFQKVYFALFFYFTVSEAVDIRIYGMPTFYLQTIQHIPSTNGYILNISCQSKNIEFASEIG